MEIENRLKPLIKTYTGTNRARVSLVNGMRPEPEDDATESVDGILVHMRRLLEDKMVRKLRDRNLAYVN